MNQKESDWTAYVLLTMTGFGTRQILKNCPHSANIVTSRYQSFHEGNEGHRTITILPIFEDWDIAAAICEAYEQRLGAGTTAKPTADRGPAICPIEKLLLHEILERRQAVRDSAERGADLA